MRAVADRVAALAALALLGGCSLAPDYERPATVAPVAYKELPAGWTEASPQDAAPRGDWWAVFGDPVLDGLQGRLNEASPTLAAAVARYDQAQAAARAAGADRFPELSVGGDASRQRVSARRPLASDKAIYNDFSVGAALDYELDLWGRVRNSVRAGKADAEASAADLASARLSLQAALADAYFRLRGLDAEAALLKDTVEAFGRALELTNTRHDGGIASGLDVSRARTVLSDARAQISAIANERAATEHEIAALVGEVASGFSIAPADPPREPPAIASGAPSDLLQRRPDIAAAERRVAAANARIGVARAALFPSITLGAGAGFEAAHGSLLSSPASYWALGPLSAVLSIFDGGRRRAEVRISRAQYDEVAADYRATVLAAFREVEDGLAAVRTLATQAGDQQAAAVAAARTRDLALIRYREGASDYLEVVTAQTAALDAERAAISVQTLRMRAAVAVVRATGGGYPA
ncbi:MULTISPECIES: efflux transporter outer membrane subunit [Sphingomonadales]|uniref:RND transporter n=2 Tax=Edaphosphingomonas TaxID=3423724 RepID=A0A2T4HMK3_9SPHN|nr:MULTISPECIES: efflux transporter outer membrane subunit [Sphingomonas]AGH51166.1 RND efflux system outer membrane lipoprotein [Sphingomonas sp. MM-1]OHT19701.1 putative efflux pump outer membrane protein TtgC precursor [Sphingomonas haloaromaticamans]PTD16998.1 RND transporter [Sphingomonas fennica]